ncbi:MAG: endonuclease/exonuclease/phosphatase family protein [Phycisphaerae bacterium]
MSKGVFGILIGVLTVWPASSWGQSVPVRVATFNIQNFDSANASQLNAAAAILLRVGSDVVCVQEIGNSTDLNDLANAAGYTHRFLASASGDIDTNPDLAGVMSVFPFVSANTLTAASLSGDPSAKDIVRNFVIATVAVPGAAEDLVIVGNHWKAGTGDNNEFRRSIESIRGMQALVGFDSAVVPFFIVGDMNDDLLDAPDSPSVFNSVPAGVPQSFSLGNDITFPVVNSVFNPMTSSSGVSHVTVANAFQVDGSDATRPASGRRLDYIWFSDAMLVSGTEVYDSQDEGLGGGLPKFGAPLAANTSAIASDHLVVFMDVLLDSGQPVVGACCLPGSVCTNGLTQTDCETQQGGFFYGSNTTCAGPLIPPCEPTGACCAAGGACREDLGTQGCSDVGGFFYGVGTTCNGPLNPPCDLIAVPLVINEVLAQPDDPAAGDFLELFGTPFSSLDGLTLVVIEGQTLSKGLVDLVLPLTGQQVGPDGYFVIGMAAQSPDLLLTNGFENGTQTLLLVQNLPGGVVQGTDVDADNDGVAEVAVGTIVDAIGLAGGSAIPDSAVYYGAPAFDMANAAFPPGAARIPNATDTDTVGDWRMLSGDLIGGGGALRVTTGAANSGDGDFDVDRDRDLNDFAALTRCYTGSGGGPPAPGCEQGDMDADGDVGPADVALFTANLDGP